MPSVQNPARGQSSSSNHGPPNPNHSSSSQRSTRDQVSSEPSPAIISSSSNVTVHMLSRRFLGPMPENIANSDDVEKKRRKFRELRHKAEKKILGRPDVISGSFGMTDERTGLSKMVHRIKVTGRNQDGRETEEIVELPMEDSGEEEGHGKFGKLKGKKKQKRKDVWVGESFDIGQEFSVPVGTERHEGDGPTANGLDRQSSLLEPTKERPATSRATTQETFITARTHPNDSSSIIANLDRDMTSSPILGREDFAPERSSTISLPLNLRNSQGSSIQPLISHEPMSIRRDHRHDDESKDQVTPVKKAPGFKNRFKSSVKQSPGGSTELSSIVSPAAAKRADTVPLRARSKSVQFNANPVTQDGGGREPPRRGNKQPADPSEVLERQGSAVVGTSAGAVEDAVEEEEEEEPIQAGSVIMRDRMLVRVGYHQKDGLKVLNEQTLRRDPTSRIDPFEEYVTVWRKGRLELYQDYKTPLKERIVGHKELCWTIALQPNRTSLSIFNATDMTIALTTSASRLDADVTKILQSKKTIHGALKNAVKESKQYKFLQRFGKSGSHVFIIKISERTRATDWFWELWRDLGGELPGRLDVQVPMVGTSVRLTIPEDDEEVGGKKTVEVLNPSKVIETCWDMLEGIYDNKRLIRDSEVGLAWKGQGGRLDWLAYDTTVQGRPRGWAILAGLARQNTYSVIELQARRARHQPVWAKLEDGTVVQEPHGIEGFLIRHKTAASAQENVYISTHDGNVFVAHSTNPYAPLQPGPGQSLRRDIFPELHEAHLDSEKQRMSLFLRNSTGCVDLRDLETISLVCDLKDAERGGKSEKDDQTFEIRLVTGEKVRLEARSSEIAKEWVERLEELSHYWKRRHRLDARQRMEVAKDQESGNTFAGIESSMGSDLLLGDIWDWCPLKGCRPITHAGRIYMKKSKYEKYRLRYVVLTGGYLVTFKIKRKQAFNQRKKVFSLFGSYSYSGRLAHDELHEQADGDAFASHPRVYHDGLNSADGIEDTTFCLRLPSTAKTWGGECYYSWDAEGETVNGQGSGKGNIPPLSKKPAALLFFRARSSLERDRWVWAINAEKERMVRSHTAIEERLRNHDKVPEH